MQDQWERYAAEERVRQLETKLRNVQAQRDAAREQVRRARGLVVELLERYGGALPRDLRDRVRALE